MIEAVNSVLSNAQALKVAAGPISSAKAADAVVEAPESVAAAPSAPYISPYISINNDYNKAIIQIRDRDTGDVVREFPSESALKARQDVVIAQEARDTRHIFKTESSETASEFVSEGPSYDVEGSNAGVSTPSPSPVTKSSSGQSIAASSALIASSHVGQSQTTVSVTA